MRAGVAHPSPYAVVVMVVVLRVVPGQLGADAVAAQQRGADPVGQPTRDGALAGARQAADEHQPHRAGAQVAQRQVGVRVRVGHGGRVTLRSAQARRLRLGEGAAGDVVVAQRGRGGVAGERGVRIEPRRRQLGPPEPLEVHGEEGGVVEPVGEAQPVVELQAVEHARPVVEAEHVVRDEVAVAVDDAVVRAPLGDQRGAARQEPPGEPLDRGDQVRGEHARRAHLRDEGRPAPQHGVAAALGRHLRVVRRRRVEHRDGPGQRAQGPLHRGAGADEVRQPPVLRHAAHDDDSARRPARRPGPPRGRRGR